MQPKIINSKTIKNNQLPSNISSYSKVFEITNFTTKDVYVIDRNNIVSFLPAYGANIDMRQRGIVVCETSRQANIEHAKLGLSRTELLRNSSKNISDTNQFSFEQLKEACNDIGRSSSVTTISHFISETELFEFTTVQDEVTGFAFTTKDTFFDIFNKESPEARYNSDIERYVKDCPSGILLEIIDNNNKIKERFTFSCNSVVTVPVRTSPKRASGLYVNHVQYYGETVSDIKTEVYLFDSKDPEKAFEVGEKKYGLFSTKEEAQTNGNPELISKRLLKEREETLQNLQLEHKRRISEMELSHKEALQEFEKSAKQREEKLTRLKEQLDKRSKKRTDYYEARSSERKDTSEMIKFIPAVLAGFVGAALLFRK